MPGFGNIHFRFHGRELGLPFVYHFDPVGDFFGDMSVLFMLIAAGYNQGLAVAWQGPGRNPCGRVSIPVVIISTFNVTGLEGKRFNLCRGDEGLLCCKNRAVKK